MRKIILLTLLLCVLPFLSPAKTKAEKNSENIARWSFSTNVVDWGWYVTPNLSVSYAVAQHISLSADARYNNWTYFNGDKMRRDRQACQNYRLSCSWWPWYVYSGWSINFGVQYSEYSRRLMRNRNRKEEGDAFGLSFGFSYDLQLTTFLNMTFGIGGWAGQKYYKLYEDVSSSCPECGRRIDGDKYSDAPSKSLFVMPNEIVIGLRFIF